MSKQKTKTPALRQVLAPVACLLLFPVYIFVRVLMAHAFGMPFVWEGDAAIEVLLFLLLFIAPCVFARHAILYAGSKKSCPKEESAEKCRIDGISERTDSSAEISTHLANHRTPNPISPHKVSPIEPEETRSRHSSAPTVLSHGGIDSEADSPAQHIDKRPVAVSRNLTQHDGEGSSQKSNGTGWIVVILVGISLMLVFILLDPFRGKKRIKESANEDTYRAAMRHMVQQARDGNEPSLETALRESGMRDRDIQGFMQGTSSMDRALVVRRAKEIAQAQEDQKGESTLHDEERQWMAEQEEIGRKTDERISSMGSYYSSSPEKEPMDLTHETVPPRDAGENKDAHKHFIGVALPHGLHMKVPRAWRVLNGETKTFLETHAESSLNLADIKVSKLHSAIIFQVALRKFVWCSKRLWNWAR